MENPVIRRYLDRINDQPTFEKVVRLINDFKDYYILYNQVVYENPSPGNKDGGITPLWVMTFGIMLYVLLRGSKPRTNKTGTGKLHYLRMGLPCEF